MHSIIIDLQIRKILWWFTHDSEIDSEVSKKFMIGHTPPSFRIDFVNIQFVKCQSNIHGIALKYDEIDWNASILLTRKLHYKIRRTNKSLYLIRLIFHRFIGCRNLVSEIISIKLHRRAIRFTDFVYSSFIEGQIFRTIKSLYLISLIFFRKFTM